MKITSLRHLPQQLLTSVLLFSSLLLFLAAGNAVASHHIEDANNAEQATDTLVVLRAQGNFPPNEMIIGSHLTGFHIKLVQAAADSIGLKVHFESVPWARAVEMLEHGHGDAITYFTRNSIREHFAIYLEDNVLSHSAHFLAYYQSHPLVENYNGGLPQLSDMTIGIEHGFSYGEAFDNSTHFKKIVVKDKQHMMALLKNRRIDFALIDDEDFYQLRDLPHYSGLKSLPVPFDQEPNYLAFSKKLKHQQLAQRFADAMKKFKQGLKYQQLVQQYPQLPLDHIHDICTRDINKQPSC